MTIRKKSTALLLGSSLVLAALAIAQQTPADLKTEKITDGVYMLVGSGGNIGVSVGADGVLIIDDQFAESAPAIRKSLAALSGKPVHFLVNTHWHGDHTGSNAAFGSDGAVIVAHDNVRRRLGMQQISGFDGKPIPPAPDVAQPTVTYASGAALHYNGEDFELEHVASAHTDGDTIVRFINANVVHMGDTFFNTMYPFIDTSSGGSIDGMIAAADHVLAAINDDTRIMPGHGPLAAKGDLVAYRQMLQAVRDNIAALIRAGKSQDEVIAAKPTADYDAAWGQGFIKPDVFAARVYVDLRRSLHEG
ncbi:MAG: MBL fold metallo-hydrolase [Steroidobacteraceae bacterium]